MRRKKTLLEENLDYLGFTLSHKTYTGKKSEKVYQYVYVRKQDFTTYNVFLDRTREHIVDFNFIDRSILFYNDKSMDILQEKLVGFSTELHEVYDFENNMALEIKQPIDYVEDCIENAFVEESVFDD